MSEGKNRRILLAARPVGMPKESDFRIEDAPISEPGPGQILVRNIYMSLDPYMRGRMNEAASYAASVELGAVMVGGGVGEVVKSNHPDYMVGEIVEGQFGWQQYAVPPYSRLRKVDPFIAPISTANGILGMPGMTAYFGFLDVGQPRAGDTVVVSAASGAVGAVVGQIARIMGCKVIGIVGGSEKADYIVSELGFDAAINYRTDDLDEALARHCPDGIDVYFENVGGEIYDAITRHLAIGARIAVCGRIAEYNTDGGEAVPRNLRWLVSQRARMEGFLVSDFYQRWPEGLERMARWISEGQMKYREDVVEGIDSAPRAFLGLFSGENFGKLLVKLSDDPTRQVS